MKVSLDPAGHGQSPVFDKRQTLSKGVPGGKNCHGRTVTCPSNAEPYTHAATAVAVRSGVAVGSGVLVAEGVALAVGVALGVGVLLAAGVTLGGGDDVAVSVGAFAVRKKAPTVAARFVATMSGVLDGRGVPV
jgi:hypothetical protein